MLRSLPAAFTAIALFACGGEADLEVGGTHGEGVEGETFLTAELAFPAERGVVKQGYFEVGGVQQLMTYEEINGEWVFEGDILLTPNKDGELGTHQGGLATISTTDGRLWPKGYVYYTIDANLPDQNRVTDAIAHWQAKTQIRFVKRTTQANYVTFRSSSGCSSSVGMRGGQQFINLARSCSTGNTIHEIGHALGAWHEQSRTDRDGKIKINWSNIQSGAEHNFKTYKERGYDGVNWGTYDFGSIMHYGSYAFSSNGKPTIVKADGSTFNGQRVGLSSGDISGIASRYKAEIGKR
jgi:hypothetical protein